jgi:hypothetical protein
MSRPLWFVGFAALLLAALVLLASSATWLPDRVATSFSTNGDAQGFMARGHYIAIMLGLTVGLPMLLLAVVDLVARHATDLLEVPNRKHWFAPERRARSAAFLRLHVARFGCALVLFFGMLHGLTLHANLREPPQLPVAAALVPLSLFAMALIAWVVVLRRRFRTPS